MKKLWIEILYHIYLHKIKRAQKITGAVILPFGAKMHALPMKIDTSMPGRESARYCNCGCDC